MDVRSAEMDGRVIALVPARGGSKGVPRKNLRPLGGRPLIGWSISAAIESGVCDAIVVSTDDAEIAEVASAAGAAVPFMRPAALATDHATSVDVAVHALDELGSGPGDTLVLLQPTSPLRSAADIAGALGTLRDSGAPALVSVTEAREHPWLAARVVEGRLEDYVPHPAFSRRQDLDPAYVINGAVYAIGAESLRRERTFRPRGTAAYVMPPERSIDIDTELDFVFAEALVGAHRLG